MLQPAIASAPSALNREAAALPSSSAAPVASVTEIVERPDGLRRGKWEAQPWVFYSIASIAVVMAVIYALFRVGVIRFKRKKPTP